MQSDEPHTTRLGDPNHATDNAKTFTLIISKRVRISPGPSPDVTSNTFDSEGDRSAFAARYGTYDCLCDISLTILSCSGSANDADVLNIQLNRYAKLHATRGGESIFSSSRCLQVQRPVVLCLEVKWARRFQTSSQPVGGAPDLFCTNASNNTHCNFPILAVACVRCPLFQCRRISFMSEETRRNQKGRKA